MYNVLYEILNGGENNEKDNKRKRSNEDKKIREAETNKDREDKRDKEYIIYKILNEGGYYTRPPAPASNIKRPPHNNTINFFAVVAVIQHNFATIVPVAGQAT